jgi:hypothetical protein
LAAATRYFTGSPVTSVAVQPDGNVVYAANESVITYYKTTRDQEAVSFREDGQFRSVTLQELAQPFIDIGVLTMQARARLRLRGRGVASGARHISRPLTLTYVERRRAAGYRSQGYWVVGTGG